MDDKIKELRESIDNLDEQIIKLFDRRMHISKDVGDYKREHNLAIYDASREKGVVDKATSLVEKELRGEVTLLMRSLMALSREYQRSLLFVGGDEFLPEPSEPKRENVRAIFQGVPGAWSEQATRKIFPNAIVSSAEYFEDVFTAVKNDDADYGIVPIENSQSGAIGETYDLLRKYGCYVVGRTWIDVRHCLISKPGATFRDIREVYSHPEGFRQCHRFLKDKPWDLIPCSNTAVAAERAAAVEGKSAAAIGSRLAAELNGLAVNTEDIMDSENNRTSFVVIGREPEYTDECDLISITFSLAHRAGSLCEALLPFTAGKIDLTRIESRPATTPDHYRFFAEVKGNIKDPDVIDTLKHVTGVTEYVEVLGCYKEI